MEKITGNELAFPTNIIDPAGRFESEFHTGLTKRELFAALILANNTLGAGHEYKAAQDSVVAADALITALNQPVNS